MEPIVISAKFFNNGLVLRKANVNDLESIQSLNNDLFNYESENNFDSYIKDWALGEVSADYFLDLIKNQFVIVAEIKNKTVGYLAGSIYQDETYSYYEGITAELDNMFIKEEYRKYGIGTKLFNSFIEWCRSKKAKRVFVTASIGNENAFKFYKKMGFSELNITLKKDL